MHRSRFLFVFSLYFQWLILQLSSYRRLSPAMVYEALLGVRHYKFSVTFFFLLDLVLWIVFFFLSVLINSLISLRSLVVKGLLSITKSIPSGSFICPIFLNFKIHFNQFSCRFRWDNHSSIFEMECPQCLFVMFY